MFEKRVMGGLLAVALAVTVMLLAVARMASAQGVFNKDRSQRNREIGRGARGDETKNGPGRSVERRLPLRKGVWTSSGRSPLRRFTTSGRIKLRKPALALLSGSQWGIDGRGGRRLPIAVVVKGRLAGDLGSRP